MSEIVIRPMEARDIQAVSGLMSQLTGREVTPAMTENRLEWVNHSPVDWLYVAEVDQQVVGAMGFRLRENIERPSRYGEISALVVDAHMHRKGVGQALTDFAEQLARDYGCIGTWLVSGFKRADEAHKFYESLGYQTTGYRFVKLFE